MTVIILLLVIGSGLVYISKFNYVPVTVDLVWYVFRDIPLFYVIVGSLLVGLLLAYIFNLIESISTSFALRGKESEIKKNKEQVLELTKRVHQLELENEKLKNGTRLKTKDPRSL